MKLKNVNISKLKIKPPKTHSIEIIKEMKYMFNETNKKNTCMIFSFSSEYNNLIEIQIHP